MIIAMITIGNEGIKRSLHFIQWPLPRINSLQPTPWLLNTWANECGATSTRRGADAQKVQFTLNECFHTIYSRPFHRLPTRVSNLRRMKCACTHSRLRRCSRGTKEADGLNVGAGKHYSPCNMSKQTLSWRRDCR